MVSVVGGCQKQGKPPTMLSADVTVGGGADPVGSAVAGRRGGRSDFDDGGSAGVAVGVGFGGGDVGAVFVGG